MSYPDRSINAPTELQGCVLWLDAAVGVTLVSSAVSQWNDQSGLNNHAVQASAASRPTVTAIGTFPAIRFDGTDDLLTLTSNITTSAVSVFIVGLMRGAPSNAYRQVVAVQNLAVYTTLGGVPNNDWGTYVGGNWTAGNPFGSTLRVTTVTKTAGTPFWLDMRQNGSRKALAKGPSTDGKTANIGGDGAGSQNADVDLCEIVIFSRALTDGEVVQVERYLQKKWAIAPVRGITSPTDLPDCAVWLDASDAASITQSGGLVSQWNDKSGNARHATASGGTRPLYSTWNGLAMVSFDGVDDAMTLASNVVDDVLGSTVLVVARKRGALSGATRAAITTRSNAIYLDINAGAWAVYRAGVRSSGEVPGTGMRIYCSRCHIAGTSSTQITIRSDGVTRAGYQIANGSDARGSTDISGQACDMDVYAIIAYTRGLTDGELISVERYLAKKYALYPERLLTSPLEIQGCQLWLDATDLASITKDGSNIVSQWADKSGNAKHAAQATPTDRPTYNATGFGGYPCLDWGTGSVTTMRLITPNISIGPATVFIVLRANTNTVNYALMVGSISDYIHIIAGDQATAGYSIRVERGGVYAFRQYAAGWLRDGVRRCVSVSFNGVKQYQTHRNGVSMGNEGNNAGANLGVTPQNYPVYVGNTDGTWYGNNAFGGVIAEVILFNRCLSDGERTMVDRYLADKYALPPG